MSPGLICGWFTEAPPGCCDVQGDQSITARNAGMFVAVFWLYSVDWEVQCAAGAKRSVLIEADGVHEVYSSGASGPAAELSHRDCGYSFLALLTTVTAEMNMVLSVSCYKMLKMTDSVTGNDGSGKNTTTLLLLLLCVLCWVSLFSSPVCQLLTICHCLLHLINVKPKWNIYFTKKAPTNSNHGFLCRNLTRVK